MTAAAAVGEIQSGMRVGIGGWGARRKPMALVRELARSAVKDLTVVSYGGPDVGLLCAADKVRKVVYGFVSLDLIPLDAHFRAARQAGKLEIMEIDEGMLQWGLKAAALRLPFLPTRAGLACDVEALNPELKTVASPYADGEVLLAMPALELDVALVHVDQADERGNAQILGPDPYFDDYFCAAAKRSFASCERIVATDEMLGAACLHTIVLDRGMVSGVIEAPFGAHPTSCVPRYGIDVDHLKTYSTAAASEDAWRDYRAKFVDVADDAYVSAVGGAKRIESIAAPIF